MQTTIVWQDARLTVEYRACGYRDDGTGEPVFEVDIDRIWLDVEGIKVDMAPVLADRWKELERKVAEAHLAELYAEADNFMLASFDDLVRRAA